MSAPFFNLRSHRFSFKAGNMSTGQRQIPDIITVNVGSLVTKLCHVNSCSDHVSFSSFVWICMWSFTFMEQYKLQAFQCLTTIKNSEDPPHADYDTSRTTVLSKSLSLIWFWQHTLSAINAFTLTMQVKALWFSYLPCHTSHQKINTILKLCDLTTRVLQRALLVPVQLVHKLYTQPLCFMPFGFNTPCQFTSLPNLHSLICGFTPFGWLHSIILSLFVMGISFFIYASLIYAHFSGTKLGHKKGLGTLPGYI